MKRSEVRFLHETCYHEKSPIIACFSPPISRRRDSLPEREIAAFPHFVEMGLLLSVNAKNGGFLFLSEMG